MGSGQTLFTMIAMMMLTMVATRVNTTILQTMDSNQNSKFGLAAISLATSRIEEASRLAFDEKTIDNPVTSLNSLTSASALGDEASETGVAKYDDIDDYDAYTVRDTSLNSAVFTVTSSVFYVNPATPDVKSTTATWHKRVLVTVTSISMRDTVRLSSIFSYWTFR